MSSVGSDIYNGAAVFGKITTTLGAIGSLFVALVLIFIGVSVLRDKKTAQTLATIISPNPICQYDMKTKGYLCSANVSYTAIQGGVSTEFQAHNIEIFSQTGLNVGDKITLYYDPENPTDVGQELIPRRGGWALIGTGVLVGGIGVGIAWLAFNYKGFAAVAGATSIFKSIF